MRAISTMLILAGLVMGLVTLWFFIEARQPHIAPITSQTNNDPSKEALELFAAHSKRAAPIRTALEHAQTTAPMGYGFLGELFIADSAKPWYWTLNTDSLQVLHEDIGHIFSIPHPDGSGQRSYMIAKRIVRGNTLSIIAQAVDDPLDTLSLVDHKGALVGSISARIAGGTQLLNGNHQHVLLSAPPHEEHFHGEDHDIHPHVHHHERYHDHYHGTDDALKARDSLTKAIASDGHLGSDPVEPVDMVIGYSQQAAVDAGGIAAIEARIIEAVDRLNDVLDDSGATTLNLELLAIVGTADVDEAVDLGEDLNDLKGTGGQYARYDDILAEFQAQGADLLHLVIAEATAGAAGMAQIQGRYGVSALEYMNPVNLTFCHEVGHNFGLKHAYGDGGGAVDSDSGRNYGIRFSDPDGNKFRTIMAYDFDWTRIPRFSNPRLNYNSTPIGFPDGIDLTQSEVTINGVTLSSDRYDPDLHLAYNGDHPNLGADAVSAIEENVPFLTSQGSRPTIDVTAPTNG